MMIFQKQRIIFSRINRTKVIIRGIFGAQYALHYSAGIFELLIKSGYEQDYRLKKGLDWLLSVRQFDGGWASPLRTNDIRYAKAIENLEPIQPDRDKPFSHTLTGFIIRAFAAHPDYRNLSDVKSAGQILKARFFKSDKYSDRKAADYWLKFQYPFWWAHILTGLDSLYYLQFPSSDPDIRRGLAWFIDHQAGDGLWPTGYDKGQLVNQNRLWVGFAVSRVLKNYFA